jgi:hypothetical protein
LAWNQHKPTFCFLPTAAVLGATVKQLRRMQEPRESQQIVKLVVGEAFQGKWLVKNVRLVSHRWEDSATPDETGAQLAAIKAHLLDHQMYLLYSRTRCTSGWSSTMLEARRRVQGEEHPHTLGSMSGLASALSCAGRHAEAVEMHRTTLEARRRVQGEEHPDTQRSKHDLARALNRLVQHAEAAEMHLTAVYNY